MSALIYNDTQINYELSNAYGKLFLNSDVALGYGIHQQTVKDHQKNNSDELIEGTHYIYDYAMTNGGRQRVIKWTSLGVYHLGFFIKSKQAKEFRKFMANVANAIDMFKINNKQDATNINIINENKLLELEQYKMKYYEALERENYLLRELFHKNINTYDNSRAGTKFLNFEIEKLKELKKQGLSIRQIAKILNRSRTAVHKYIKSIKIEMEIL